MTRDESGLGLEGNGFQRLEILRRRLMSFPLTGPVML